MTVPLIKYMHRILEKKMNRTHLILSILIALCLLGTASTVSAQVDFEKKIGMTVSIQTGQNGLSFPYWISQGVTLTPSVAYSSLTDNGSSLELGLGLRFNRSTSNSVPYFGFRVGFDFDIPESGDTRTRTLLGTMVGGEHFLDDHFSLGVEFQANLLMWKQPGWSGETDMTLITTGAAALATYYF